MDVKNVFKLWWVLLTIGCPPKGDYYYTFMGGEAKWLKFDKML